MSTTIHPTAVVDPSVSLGDGVVIGPYAVILGQVSIGSGSWIGPHVTIGTPPQFSTEKFELHGHTHGGIRIGERVVIRENANIHQPSKYETIVEDDAYVMSGANINHDVRIGRGAIISSNTKIAGFCDIGERANLGLGVTVHQFSTIGAYTMIGMSAVITKDVPPFVKAAGNPARIMSINDVGMQRNGFTPAQIASVRAYLNGSGVKLDAACERYFRAMRERRAITKRPTLYTDLKELAS